MSWRGLKGISECSCYHRTMSRILLTPTTGGLLTVGNAEGRHERQANPVPQIGLCSYIADPIHHSSDSPQTVLSCTRHILLFGPFNYLFLIISWEIFPIHQVIPDSTINYVQKSADSIIGFFSHLCIHKLSDPHIRRNSQE